MIRGRTGYALMQEIERRSEGAWKPSPGSVYPALAQLEDEGLITRDADKQYALTDAGREQVDALPEDRREPWAAMAEGIDDGVWTLFDAARQLAAAVQQLAQVGTAAQHERAREVLVDARRKVYGLLAEDADAEPDAVDPDPA